jgi:autotransporter-associated beta strand protein
MSKKLNLSSALGIFLIGLFSANVSQAQTNAYWDPSGTNNAGEGGSATWSTSGTNWTTNSVNATANSGGPTGGGLFAVANGASGATLTNSGNFIFNFGGTAGTVTQGGAFQAVGVNFLTTGYIWNIDGTGSNGRTITTTNAVNLGANALTLANGPRGLNSFTFTGPTAATAQGITGTSGSTLTLRNLFADTATNSFGVYLSGGTISSNIAINVDIGTGSKIAFGSQSSSGMTNYAAMTLNTNVSGVALNITNSSSGTVAMNGVISGASGLVLDNASTGKIALNAANTYSGGTILNNSGNGAIITFSNAAAFGTGTITSAGAVTNYVRAEVTGLDVANNWQIDSGSIVRLNANPASGSITASGVIAGAGSMMFSNSGINYYLTGTNSSFGGGVTVGNGTLYFSKLASAGQNSSLGTNGTITIGGPSATTTGGLRWIGTTNEISDKTIVVAGTTGGLSLLANGATNASLTLNGNINSTGAGAKTLTFGGYSTNTLTLNGLINENGGVNSVVIGASSSGTVVLGNANNSFSGAITVTNGTAGQYTYLSTANIGNAGQNSALGKNGTINIGSSSATAFTTLTYTGTGETSDKVINLAGTTGGAILDQSGTGNLKFTSAMTATGVGAKTITLTGSTTGTGELAGAISNQGANAISLTKSGTGTWTLSGANSYTGITTINGGTLATGGNEVLSDNNTVTVGTGATFKLGGNETVASVAGAGTVDLQSNTLTYGGTGATAHSALAIGTGGLVKNGSGFLSLGQSNSTYSGGFTLNSGTARYTQNGVVSNGVVTSGVFGTGTLTINGGTVMGGGAGGLYVTRMLVNSNFTVNSGSYSNSSDNGRTSFAGVMDLAGDTRTISLGRWTNAAGVLASGWESFRFQSNNLLPATITNGTVRFVREGLGSSSDYAAVNFNAGMVIAQGVGITIGTNVITTIASSDPWGTNSTPNFTVEQGGIFNLSTDTGARNVTVRTLGGEGLVTSLGVTNATSVLTVGTQAGDSATFSGRIVDGSSLNATLGTVANNLGIALTKSGSGTQILSGSNSYSGLTTVRDSGSLLKLMSTDALSAKTSLSGENSLAAAGTIDFGVGGSYTANSFGTLSTSGNNMYFTNSSGSAVTLTFTNANNYITALGSGGRTLTASSSNLNLDFDGNIEIGSTATNTTTFRGAGSFNVDGNLLDTGANGSRTLQKDGEGTLTLRGSGNNYRGSTTVNSGKLDLYGSVTASTNITVSVDGTVSPASATRTATATLDVKSGATLLNNSTTTVYSGGNLIVNGTAGDIVLENNGLLGGAGTVGAVTLKSGSLLTPGNSPGTLTAASSSWAAGSTYEWQINDATGTAGTNWDLFSVVGALDLSALSSTAQMNLVLESLSIANYSTTSPYTWVIAQAGSFIGTDLVDGTNVTSFFNIDAADFNGGVGPANGFKVEVGTDANSLRTLNLMAIPEPSTGSLMMFGLSGLVLTRLLRRKVS